MPLPNNKFEFYPHQEEEELDLIKKKKKEKKNVNKEGFWVSRKTLNAPTLWLSELTQTTSKC